MAQLDGKLLPTTVVGSYPQPDWLFDRSTFALRSVPRVRTPDVWRMSGVLLEQAQDDATILAIRAMECAGVDIVTDGEIRREGMSNRFATALEGVDGKRPAKVPSFVPGQTQDALRVVGPVRRSRPVMVYDAAFLRANTRHLAKMTLPGPFSLSQEVVNEYYDDDETLALDYATAVRAELVDIAAAGVDVIQLDEPWLQNRPDAAQRFGVKAINAALRGISATTALHLCFGYGWRRPAQAKYSAYAFFEELGDRSR
jgi:5-methyltetrahydropteroyltriglutamate--homocysteine methyltransferase